MNTVSVLLIFFLEINLDMFLYGLGTVHDLLAYETISKPFALFPKIHGCQCNPKCICLI